MELFAPLKDAPTLFHSCAKEQILSMNINGIWLYYHLQGQRFSAFWAPKAHAFDPIRRCHVLLHYFKNKKHVNLVFRIEKRVAL